MTTNTDARECTKCHRPAAPHRIASRQYPEFVYAVCTDDLPEALAHGLVEVSA